MASPWDRDLQRLERELDRVRRELESETDKKIHGLVQGLDAHIRGVVMAAVNRSLEPHVAQLKKLEQLDDVVAFVERQEVREQERERARKEAEERRRIADEEAERLLGLRVRGAELQDKRIDGPHRRRMAWLGLLVAALVPLAGLVGAMLASHH